MKVKNEKNGSKMRIYWVKLLSFLYVLFFFTKTSIALDANHYHRWKVVGEKVAVTSQLLFNYGKMVQPNMSNLIVLTNAGYAEVNGETTEPALDGIADVLGVSRGSSTLIEVHSVYDSDLWFAVYDKISGYCFYCTINPDEIESIRLGKPIRLWQLFSKYSVEKIDAEYLFKYPEKWPTSFGGDAFRIVTIANGVAYGTPYYAVRSFEFHDHYCPGVSSGILIANFAKKYFKDSAKGSYFVQGLQPWCKEDALLVMLNATPGKGGYAVNYHTPEITSKWVFPNAHNIIYRQNPKTGLWEGVVVQFVWGDTSHCNKYEEIDKKTGGNVMRLCGDLWYLERLNRPEDFVKPIYKFTLEKGKGPKDYAKPGFDIMLPGNLPPGERIVN